MYGVYRLLKALVFDEEAADSKETRHVKPGPGKEQQLPKEPQKRYFTGEITSLFENSGMIDQQVSCAAGQGSCRLVGGVTASAYPCD